MTPPRSNQPRAVSVRHIDRGPIEFKESLGVHVGAQVLDLEGNGPTVLGSNIQIRIALLRRILIYAVKCGELPRNPIEGVKLLRKPNIRRVVVSEAAFQDLLVGADEMFRPILLVAYDHGLRKGEILHLRWSQLDLREGTIRLAPQDTKGGEHRTVYLTGRTLQALNALPRRLATDYVFVNPLTGKPWQETRKMFRRACQNAKLEGIWFHDLRRSFVTNARRRGVPESVVMKLSGHKTRSVFDRYNVVSEDDLKSAVRRIESGSTAELAAFLGHDLDTVSRSANVTRGERAANSADMRGKEFAPGGS